MVYIGKGSLLFSTLGNQAHETKKPPHTHRTFGILMYPEFQWISHKEAPIAGQTLAWSQTSDCFTGAELLQRILWPRLQSMSWWFF